MLSFAETLLTVTSSRFDSPNFNRRVMSYLKAIERTLVSRTSRLAVDPNLCVRHRAVKHQADDLSFPVGGNSELQAILSLFVCQRVRIADAIAPVVVTAEALLLPARGHRNLCPNTTLAPARAEKIPQHGVVFSGAGEIANNERARLFELENSGRHCALSVLFRLSAIREGE